jgi:hypothetical protein
VVAVAVAVVSLVVAAVAATAAAVRAAPFCGVRGRKVMLAVFRLALHELLLFLSGGLVVREGVFHVGKTSQNDFSLCSLVRVWRSWKKRGMVTSKSLILVRGLGGQTYDGSVDWILRRICYTGFAARDLA